MLPECSASIGVAELKHRPETEASLLGEQLLQAADQKLYRAKRAGRNCVIR